VPNFYFKYNDDEIVDYYKRIAAESELPVIAYAQGLLTSDSVNLMKRLIDVDGVIGVKYTLTDFYSMRRIKELNGGDINVINGPDEMFICGLSMGADAGIGSTYNLMCAEYVKIRNLFLAGDIEGARATQYKVNKVVEILIKYGVIRSIKHVLSLDGIEAGDIAYPGSPLTDCEKKGLVDELTNVGFFTDYNK
jgi:N-acetylneuraminate lyase